MDPVMRILQIQSQTLICPGKVCLLSQVMMSSVILRILRAIQTAATRKSYLTSSGQPPDAPTTAESSSAPTDSSGSQSSGNQGRDNY